MECPDCQKDHGEDGCPKCGRMVSLGFGLAAGDIGLYRFCLGEGCDYMEAEGREDGEPRCFVGTVEDEEAGNDPGRMLH